ncbi:hypothetical protein, partial [Pseudomonas viridiflava]|uniref:hypothetical protein n=1 Tax=Pseudomonas viridiflava TaxID=33069 RepID=UPI001980B6D4
FINNPDMTIVYSFNLNTVSFVRDDWTHQWVGQRCIRYISRLGLEPIGLSCWFQSKRLMNPTFQAGN